MQEILIMPSTSKSVTPAANSAKAGPSKKKTKTPKAAPPSPPAESSESEPNAVEDAEGSGSDSDSDDDGVDEEGMERLINALGEDGLDDFDRAQLKLATGDEDEGEGSSDEGENGVEAGDAGEMSGESLSGSDAEGEANDGEGDDADVAMDGEEVGGDSEASDEEEDLALDEVDDAVDEDVVPRQKIEIDNTVALRRIRENIQLDPSLPWTETLVVSYPETIDVDVTDDLNRELAFYKQALHGANAARALAAKNNFPFTRPSDYFAEMVKSDSHMERIRQRLLNESAGIKKSDEKRKEREGKKFGKQVQIEKLKEREKSKKEMQEKLKGLKRKRGDMLDKPQADDGFDIAVEDAVADRPAKRGRGAAKTSLPRKARDQKFGFGGAGRRAKQNTKDSTDDFGPSAGRGGGRGARGGGRGGRGGRGGGAAAGRGSKRLGKSRRISARGK